ncbi:Pycsar system effector family protein [Soonwooa sp.]|uniref:Pycsar system effector family protein n=1 Tax=Soonwooa sp. TaxID=1938592 RepID=UPI00289CCF8C|nr:Pycsar system effector family protein [Soonwooa sp.]
MNIVNKAEQYVIQLFKDKLSPVYSFHNLEHTKRVVAATELLATEEHVNEKDKEILTLAAWFHDVGYCQTCAVHENVGMQEAETFLKQENVSTEEIEAVKQLILATSLGYTPQNLLEKIMKDADGSHIGSKDFFSITESLRQECKQVYQKKISKLDWANTNLQFLTQTHHFYTDFAKKNWEETKAENIEKTIEQIAELIEDKDKKNKSDDEKALLNKKKLEKIDSPERGIETMFRVTMNNHTRLSQIADSKANILLSVNAIIISVALSTIIPKLDSPKNAHLVIPTFVMIGFSVASIIMAIMSTRPKISSGTFTRKEIEERKVNLLFFGNFHKMPIDEYMWAMKEMMKDRTYLYDSLVKDLYYLGIVLNRKYKLLRTTYTIFTVGILVSVLTFYLAFREII